MQIEITWPKLLLACVAVLAALLSGAYTLAVVPYGWLKDDLKQQGEDLHHQIDRLDSVATTLGAGNDSTAQQVVAMQKEMLTDLGEIKSQLAAITTKTDDLRTEVQDQMSDMKAKVASLTDRVGAMSNSPKVSFSGEGAYGIPVSGKYFSTIIEKTGSDSKFFVFPTDPESAKLLQTYQKQ